jgi:manganese transport protein
LLFSGLSSSITAGMAGGSIFAGIYAEAYDIKDIHTKAGILITMIPAALIIFFISSPFDGLIYSQMILSIQLPLTVFSLVYLTSSRKVMGKYANSKPGKIILWGIGLIVAFLNIALLINYL